MNADADARMAGVARALAEALAARGRERTAASNLRVAELQTELCALWRKEQTETFAAMMPTDDQESP